MPNWYLTRTYVEEHNLPIIPCGANSKIPACKWASRKTTTLGEVKTWSVQNKDYNIGLILGETKHHNIVGIDIDGKEGIRRWAELVKENGPVPDTWTFTTPSGGMRLLYSLPMGMQTKKAKDLKALDGQHQEVAFICQGQQTVLPPSKIGTKEYVWTRDKSPNDIPLAGAPVWIVNKVKLGTSTLDLTSVTTEITPYSEPVTADECEGLKEGQGRNNAMTRIAGSYASLQLMSLDKLLMLCEKDNESMANPLDHVELATIVNSVWNSESKKREIKKEEKEEKLNEHELAMLVQEGLFKDGLFIRYRTDRNEFFTSTMEKGPWESVTDEFISGKILMFLSVNNLSSSARVTSVRNITEHLKLTLPNWFPETGGLKEEDNLFIKSELDCKKICVENGVLDFQTGKIESWNPDKHYYTSIISGAWTSTVDEQLRADWDKAFATWIPDTDSRLYLQEFMGYCLTPNCKRRAMTFLTGSGLNGKGMFIDIVSSLFRGYTFTLDIKDINTDFGLEQLPGKKLCVNSDMGATKMQDTGKFKRMVTGEEININRKNKPVYTMSPTCKFMFAVNELPKSPDKTDGLISRINPVHFPNKFVEDSHFHDEMMTKFTSQEGRSMLLSWMVEGLVRLEKNNKFTLSAEMKESKEEYKTDNDNVTAFFKDVMLPYTSAEMDNLTNKERGISIVKYYAVYRAYSEFEGIRKDWILTKRQFGNELTTIIGAPAISCKKDGKVIKGRATHKFNEEFEGWDTVHFLEVKCMSNL